MDLKVKTREEIEKKYTWNLEKIFANEDEVNKALEEFESKIEEAAKFKGVFTKSASNLLKMFVLMDELDVDLTKIATYINNRYNEDTTNTKFQEFSEKLNSLYSKFSAQISFFDPELLELDLDTINNYYLEEPKLEIYKREIDRKFTFKPHTLSTAEEEMISTLRPALSTGSKGFQMLTNADMKFPEIEHNGEKVRLTQGNYGIFMESKDRELRKEVYNKLYTEFVNHKNILATTLDGTIKTNSLIAKIKKFDSARQKALFNNEIPISVYEALVDTVNKNLHELQDFVEMKGRALGIKDDIEMYDIYPSIADDSDMTFTFDEAKDIIIDALQPLGEEYIERLKYGFENRWCDVYETKGKRSGAYSSGGTGTEPYILLNYHESLDNMFTVAHEFGHSMHTYFSCKNQIPAYSGYSIFVAEVASTLNESLLTYYLLDKYKDDIPKKKVIISHFLDTIRGTLFRQTQFAEFERDIYDHYEKGGAITADYLYNHYLEINKKYYGKVGETDLIGYEWARIPHFYYNFYVYQYATGISAALSFAKRILEGGEQERDMYLGFLKSGSSSDPITVLKRAGVDLSTPKPVEDAIEVFKQFKEELKLML